MWKSVFLVALLGTGVLALPADSLKNVIAQLKKDGMTGRNIYQSDSDDDSIAVALQFDKSWGDGNGNGFVMSLHYKEANAADTQTTDVFSGKTWAQLANYKVDWGKLNGYNHAVSIDGLSSGTAYTVFTNVQDSSGNRIGGQSRTISTTGTKKYLDEELEELINKLKAKEMSNRNIYQTDSDSDSIAVFLQKDASWGAGFTMSLYYKSANTPRVALFTGKTWSELERSEWAVNWGQFNGYKYAVSIDNLDPGTSYVVETEVYDSGGAKIGGQSKTVSTKAAKSLDVKAFLKALKDLL